MARSERTRVRPAVIAARTSSSHTKSNGVEDAERVEDAEGAEDAEAAEAAEAAED